MSDNILIAYFSHEGEAYVGGNIVDLKIGNTKVAAQMLERLTDGKLYRIETKTPYPYDHMETVNIAKKEQGEDFRPKLKALTENIADYDIVILGYPNMEQGFNGVSCA